MDFGVAVEDTNFTIHDWFGINLESIPKDVVINAQGKVAWIGEPKDLSEVLAPNLYISAGILNLIQLLNLW